jgi:glycosyltransferase involved in cell wall biosynthesis
MVDGARNTEEESEIGRSVSSIVPGNDKIKLLYIIDCLNIGGTEKQLIELINRLDRKKFDLYLCCLRDSEYLQKLKLDCNVHILDLRKLVSIRGLRKLVNLSEYIRSKNIQIVQTFFIDANIVGTIAARLAGTRVIISSRREMVYWYTPKILYAFKFLKHFTTKYLANSSNVRDYVSEKEGIQKNRIDVLYNGIDLSRYSVDNKVRQSEIRNEIGAASDDAIVGIVSNLNRPVKRVDVFLMAAAEVLGKGFNALFVIVGEGYLKEQLQRMGKELGITEKLRFIGSKENVVPYIQSFSIAVNSSESEGFSNAVLEYMACGVPVVATNFGGSSEAVIHGETGLLVNPNNHIEMADAIIELLQDPQTAKSMGSRGRTRVESNFAFEVVVERQEHYYAHLLSREPSGKIRRIT